MRSMVRPPRISLPGRTPGPVTSIGIRCSCLDPWERRPASDRCAGPSSQTPRATSSRGPADQVADPVGRKVVAVRLPVRDDLVDPRRPVQDGPRLPHLARVLEVEVQRPAEIPVVRVEAVPDERHTVGPDAGLRQHLHRGHGAELRVHSMIRGEHDDRLPGSYTSGAGRAPRRSPRGTAAWPARPEPACAGGSPSWPRRGSRDAPGARPPAPSGTPTG